LTFPNSYWVQTVELCGPNCTSRVQWMCGLWPTFLRMCGCANLPPTQDSVRLGFRFGPNFLRIFVKIADFRSEFFFFRFSGRFSRNFPIFRHATSRTSGFRNFRSSSRNLVDLPVFREENFFLKVLNVFGHTFVARDSHDVEPITFDQVLQIFADFRRFVADFGRFLTSSS
jgi:hypothetical protein